jgi:flagellar assembly protein FliH
MSFSGGYTSLFPASFSSLQYRDIADPDSSDAQLGEVDPLRPEGHKRIAEVQMSDEEFAARIRQERADASAQTEQRLRQEYDQKLAAARAPIVAVVKEFAVQREDYFARVESEIVQLALSIAAKILHREAQVDPMLIAALVRIAVEKMQEGSSVSVRIGMGRGAAWQQYFSALPIAERVQVVEDANLSEYDCIFETELGSANFGLDSQLKEVEKGFFDLLALRPVAR